MATKKKSHPKMDPKLVSGQLWELKYVAHRYSTTVAEVRKVKKQVGRSRTKVYAELKRLLVLRQQANEKKKG